MQNDALEQIRKAEADNQTRIQSATQEAADRLRQASGDREVRLREKEAALRKDLSEACAQTEQQAASLREEANGTAQAHAKAIRNAVAGKMDDAVAYVVDAILTRAARTS